MLHKVIIIIAVFMTITCLQTINNAGKNVAGVIGQYIIKKIHKKSNLVRNMCRNWDC